MDLVMLGTSAGVPTRNRNGSGTALIESSGRGWYLVDCGEATQHQLLRTSLSLRELRGCCITHVHGDHCFGLPGLLATAGMSGRLEPLDIVLPAALHAWVRLSLTASECCLDVRLSMPDGYFVLNNIYVLRDQINASSSAAITILPNC